MQAINGNKEAISSLSNTLNCDINAVQTALNTINSGVSQISCDTKLSSCEVINAITSGNATLASELANCCCTTQRSIDAVNNNITKMCYENHMLFNQLSIGDKVYIIEVVGTFKKTTEYNEGSVTQVSAVYDEPLPPGQFPMPNQTRKRVVDITIQCNGETKKFTIPENKSVITDSALGLTISTDKQEIINIVRNQYNTYKQRKESIAKCDEEMAKCQALLDKLGINDKPAKENDEIIALQKEVNELKNIIRKANQMVPPPMKEMLPQDMKNAMDKVGQ